MMGVNPLDNFHRFSNVVGNVVKYILRYNEKGGVVDLEKARWYIDRLIEQAHADG